MTWRGRDYSLCARSMASLQIWRTKKWQTDSPWFLRLLLFYYTLFSQVYFFPFSFVLVLIAVNKNICWKKMEFWVCSTVDNFTFTTYMLGTVLFIGLNMFLFLVNWKIFVFSLCVQNKTKQYNFLRD